MKLKFLAGKRLYKKFVVFWPILGSPPLPLNLTEIPSLMQAPLSRSISMKEFVVMCFGHLSGRVINL